MIYQSPDNRFGLQLRDDVVSEMRTYISTSHGKETGGILIGFYNEMRDVAVVTKVSGPPNDSLHGYTWFKRGTKGLQHLLYKLWRRKEYYLGEWHHHPNASATPSHVDKTQMKEIANNSNYHCPEPILIIVGGSVHDFEIKVFVLTRSMKLLELRLHSDKG